MTPRSEGEYEASESELPAGSRERTVDAFVRALQDKRVSVRRRAVWALGDLQDPRALEPLVRALKDSDPGDDFEALELDESGLLPTGELRRKHAGVRGGAARALGALQNKQAFEALVRGLKDKRPGVRREVVIALGQLRDERAEKPIVKALRDDHVAVRCEALDALFRLLGERALGQLFRLLKKEEGKCRREIVRILGNLPGEASVAVLVKALEDPWADIQVQASLSLLKLRSLPPVPPKHVSDLSELGANWSVREALSRDHDDVDGHLLRDFVIGRYPWLDLSRPISRQNVAALARAKSISEREVRSRYSRLAEEFGLRKD